MMEEMPFEDIKVKELCDRAMIRKSTFYKHFADKYELLAFIVKEVINDYNASGRTALRMTRWLSTIRCWIMYLNLQKRTRS